MATRKRGKFIVLYGINNLGKTTQAKRLVKSLKKKGKKAEYIKYPIYDMPPAGPLLNGYLRKGNPHKFTPREFELLHFIDRLMFNPILQKKLDRGINVIAEDYFGTAIAWGAGCGVDKKLLEHLYTFVYPEDLAILFDGDRFMKSVEKNHKHETDDLLIKNVRQIHRVLGKKYGWQKVDANMTIEELQKIIEDKVRKII
jgi:thymidylate kinase